MATGVLRKMAPVGCSKIALMSGILWVVLGLAACRTTPITHRSQLILIAEPQEVAMGFSSYKTVLSKAKLSTNQARVAQVRKVGERIAAVANRPDYRWEFNLIQDDKMVNAFALPGGKVAVYTGILPITQDDAGLATVMSHEVAHAIARHGGERMTTGMLAQLGQAALNAALSGKDPATIQNFNDAYGLGTQLGVLLPFSRNQESEADRIGLVLMARAGYDPKAAIEFWRRMSKVSQNKVPEFAATHPSDETRIRVIREWLPEAEKEYRPAMPPPSAR